MPWLTKYHGVKSFVHSILVLANIFGTVSQSRSSIVVWRVQSSFSISTSNESRIVFTDGAALSSRHVGSYQWQITKVMLHENTYKVNCNGNFKECRLSIRQWLHKFRIYTPKGLML